MNDGRDNKLNQDRIQHQAADTEIKREIMEEWSCSRPDASQPLSPQPSNIVPSIRTPIFCLISMPSSFIFPACPRARARPIPISTPSRPRQRKQHNTHLDPLVLDLAELHELLLVHVRVVLDRAALVGARVRTHVRGGVVPVVRGRNVLARAQCSHAPLVLVHVVELLVRKCRCAETGEKRGQCLDDRERGSEKRGQGEFLQRLTTGE